jgi:hypothetical protein
MVQGSEREVNRKRDMETFDTHRRCLLFCIESTLEKKQKQNKKKTEHQN